MPYKRPDSKYVQIRVGGVRQSSGTTDPETAKAIEHKRNLELLLAEQLGIKPAKSFKEMCVRWAREKKGKVTWHDDVRSIAFWDQHFGNLNDIRLINREKVDEIAQKEWAITEGPSPVNNTANHYISVLTSMLNAACRVWDWIERSPKLRAYPIIDGRKGWLRLEQWRALEPVLQRDYPHYWLPGKFDLGSGLRASRVFRAEWPQISMNDRALAFEGTANKLGNLIPLNDTCMDVLREIRRSKFLHHLRVFTRGGVPMQRWNDGWYGALKKAGLPSTKDDRVHGVCWHTFRHTWNSWLAQRGVPKEIRNRLGGWVVSDDNADRYTHLDIDSLRPYAAVIDTILSQGVDGREENAAAAIA
ncbi:MAG TPA: tyrosine-type recombinase/integrase [Burkholderiales bacterium]|nr:tyrosine-type recombinase/integrase [Burkholderiales bacterium]